MNSYLRHLVNFAHVVNAGSITAAANRENASPSTMSASVKIIENLAGQPLLERGRAGVRLLSEGRRFYEEATVIQEALERLSPAQSGADLAGEVRISLPVELATGWFEEAVRAVTTDLPEVNLVLMVEDRMMDHLKHTRDLYMRVSRARSVPGLHVLESMRSEAVLIGSPALLDGLDRNDPLAVTDLRFICAPLSGEAARLSLADGEALEFPNLLEVSDIVTRIHFARRGLGLTCCIGSTVADEIRDGQLLRLLPDRFGPDLTLLLGAPRRNPPTRVREVARLIASCFPANQPRS